MAAGRPCWSSATMRFHSGSAATKCGSCNSWVRERRQKARTRSSRVAGCNRITRAPQQRWPLVWGCGAFSSRMDRRLHARPQTRCWTRCWAQRFATSRPERSGSPRWRRRPNRREPRADARSSFRLAPLRRWERPATRSRSARLSARRRRRTSSCTRRPRAERRPGSLPAAGCTGSQTRVIGISADDPAPALRSTIRRLLFDLEQLRRRVAGDPGRFRD